MNRLQRLLVATCATALLSLGAPAMAEKPEWAGGGKHKDNREHQQKGRDDPRVGRPEGKHEGKQAKGKRSEERRAPRVGGYFNDRDRQVARVYYDQRYDGGRKSCPPGLAKKNNGCMPPGQAKKYEVGHRLPPGVAVYPVPHAVLIQLPPPPAGHKYVRIAADILLIAVGSSMVVDAMSDLLRM